MNYLFKNNRVNKKGFALVDVILGITLFAIVLIFTVPTFLYGQESAVIEGKRQRAIKQAQAGLEIVRNIRDNNWTDITPGTFGIQEANPGWTLTGSSDTNGEFTRKIDIELIDVNRYLVRSTVNWEQNRQRHGEVSFETRLTNFQKETIPEPTDYFYEITMANDWLTGFCADVIVETDSKTELEWEINIDLSEAPFDGEPYEVWNVNWEYNEPILTTSGQGATQYISKNNPATFGFCANRSELPIEILDVRPQPTDNQSLTGQSVDLDPYPDLLEGDFVVVLVSYNGSGNIEMQKNGGQDWNPVFDQVNNNNNLQTKIFTTIFNGSWQGGNPVFKVKEGKDSMSVTSYYFRNTDPYWAIDTWENSGTFSVNSNPFDITINSINTTANDSMALAFFISNDTNEWYLQNLDWNVLGNSQYRNSNGGISVSSAYKVLETPGNTGDVVNRVIPASNTSGNWHIFSINKYNF
ncbi:MAG: hypothetical protein PF488_00015 [Patescibacteria group bacterium]|jgi:type II secretory pathway pseudopilin PulG|nr:hypothetical protein [Patescibacteria group bacterium]